ncbi:CapA family protein [Uliginosibacterium sp. H3]|uniref:CapA family protein n=1 Tax=Uliginosibacterium silvisoli TaxID=3114758 RepID=A0ABU6K952_9RHOO|nr:CapA family protein [Uliginosibacterium sp. H3]
MNIRLSALAGCMLCLLLSATGSAQAETVKLSFVGDLMLDDGPGKVIASGRDPLVNFADLLKQADYSIGNLECPVATTGTAMASKIFTFRAKPQTLQVLKGRFQGLSVANNHSGDYGKKAFLETLQHLKANGFEYFGGGRNLAEAHAPLWIERKGLKIAVLGYDEYKPRSFEAGPDWPGIAWSEDGQVIADIRAARAAGADLVIPMMHWGWEREPNPSERQRQLARTMIDAGADMVVGGHPHITQGAEYYNGKLIVYSLGNFVFDSFTTPATRTGWLLRLTLDKRGVVAWDTVGAFMDEEGVPQRMPGTSTPCGSLGETTVRYCVNE